MTFKEASRTRSTSSAPSVAKSPANEALGSRTPPRPFIKWAGGKTRLLGKLLPHIPDRFRSYHEPFLGGGAMFFAVSARATRGAYLADLNPDLINAWLCVRDRGPELQVALRRYLAEDSKEFYYSVRPLQPGDPVERAARFIYLNQTSWNGLWRVNRWGGFNVPWGERPFRGISTASMLQLQSLLRDADIAEVDFRKALARPKRGDFVYLDPPYLPLSDTSKFHLYTEKRFREPDLRELAEVCRRLSNAGVNWLLSNRDTSLVRGLFKDYRILALTTHRSVAAQNKRHVEAKRSPEVIVVGVGE